MLTAGVDESDALKPKKNAPPEPTLLLNNNMNKTNDSQLPSDSYASSDTQWVSMDNSQNGQPKIAKKEITFTGSGKKAQPKQARSSSKPKTYEVNQGVGGTSNTQVGNNRGANRY